jgi:hypothetical protein
MAERHAGDPYHRFFSYDQFSMIDIVSFAILTFAGFLILFLLIYLIALRIVNKKITGNKQFIYFPTHFFFGCKFACLFFNLEKHGRSLWQQRSNSFYSWISYQRLCIRSILGMEK